MRRLNSKPIDDGYRMPGEFERHKGTYMIWPERPDNWRNGAKPAQKVFTEVANTIGKYEPTISWYQFMMEEEGADNVREMVLLKPSL